MRLALALFTRSGLRPSLQLRLVGLTASQATANIGICFADFTPRAWAKPRDQAVAIHNVAEQLIRARTSGSRSCAKARGVKLGRKPKLTAHQRREAIKRRAAADATRDIALSYNVSHSKISRLA
jgi:hypothetical protein